VTGPCIRAYLGGAYFNPNPHKTSKSLKNSLKQCNSKNKIDGNNTEFSPEDIAFEYSLHQEPHSYFYFRL
uniref:hypothetical protein n=1 Tax=uncultured Vibrio sp. TaxID=114054 RepID=UPI002609607B